MVYFAVLGGLTVTAPGFGVSGLWRLCQDCLQCGFNNTSYAQYNSGMVTTLEQRNDHLSIGPHVIIGAYK